jgi:2,3-dihydroxybiphenyl 1,2-dioxygenase
MIMAIELAYIGVEVADQQAFEAMLQNVIGLVPGQTSGTWRNDERAQRVLVTEGSKNDATVIGFETESAAAAEAIAEKLRALGFPVEKGSESDCGARKVEVLWRTTAPWGVSVEIVHGLAVANTPFASALVPGGFKTNGMGFGHCVFAIPNADDAHRFVVDGLGLKQTDWLDLKISPDFTLSGRFYHGNPRHHSMALIAAPAPKMLHHFMVETQQRDDTGNAFDRAFAAGLPLPSGLGQHDNDKMFSFYAETLAGFQIEVGYGAREVGPDWNENRAYDRISQWGHQPVGRAS